MNVLLLLGFAGLVHRFERPLHFALMYAGLIALLSIVFGAFSWWLVPTFLGTLAFTAVYFSLLHRFSDTVLLWLGVLVGGALLWFFLPIVIGA
nr:hypothetical protein [uncultured Caldimonas sp.]